MATGTSSPNLPDEIDPVPSRKKRTQKESNMQGGGDSVIRKNKHPQTDVYTWKDFHYVSINEFADGSSANHWLPSGRHQYEMRTHKDHYEEFDTLIHATSLETAHTIMKENQLKPRRVQDSSVVNPFFPKLNTIDMKEARTLMHPISNVNVLWYGPYLEANIGNHEKWIERYGNVAFTMRRLHGYEGIRRDGDPFKYYFIEQIDYETQSACRILVTRTEYPGLREFNPAKKGGPWYFTESGNKYIYYHLTHVTNNRGDLVPNTLEIMREEHNDLFTTAWQRNHVISYSKCSSPRTGVECNTDETSEDIAMNSMKLILGAISFDTLTFRLHPKLDDSLKLLKTIHDEINKDKKQIIEKASSDESEEEREESFREYGIEEATPKSLSYFHKYVFKTEWQSFDFKPLYRRMLEKVPTGMKEGTRKTLAHFREQFFKTDGQSFETLYREMLGKVPTGMEEDFYQELCRLCRRV